MESIPRIQKVISVAWPSFLVAGLTTIIFFTLFDPKDFLANTRFHDASRMSAYTIGFFCFWAMNLMSCCLTCFFQQSCVPCKDINSRTDTGPDSD